MRGICLLFLCPLLPASQMLTLTNGVKVEYETRSDEGNTVFLTQRGGMSMLLEKTDIVPPPPPPVVVVPESSVPGSAPGSGVHKLIENAGNKHGIDPDLIHAVAAMESGYQQSARSGSGAVGIMQLMPATARHFGADPADAEQNIDAGTRFLRELLMKYEGNPNQLALALAAYNAGPGAVDRFGGIPPYVETRRYVNKVIRRYNSLGK